MLNNQFHKNPLEPYLDDRMDILDDMNRAALMALAKRPEWWVVDRWSTSFPRAEQQFYNHMSHWINLWDTQLLLNTLCNGPKNQDHECGEVVDFAPDCKVCPPTADMGIVNITQLGQCAPGGVGAQRPPGGQHIDKHWAWAYYCQVHVKTWA
jgi:hypothetical protein